MIKEDIAYFTPNGEPISLQEGDGCVIVQIGLMELLKIPGSILIDLFMDKSRLVLNCQHNKYIIDFCFTVSENASDIKLSSNSNPPSTVKVKPISNKTINKTKFLSIVENFRKDRYIKCKYPCASLESNGESHYMHISLALKKEFDNFLLGENWVIVSNEKKFAENIFKFHSIRLSSIRLKDEGQERHFTDQTSLIWCNTGSCLFRRGYIKNEKDIIERKIENDSINIMTSSIQNNNPKVIFLFISNKDVLKYDQDVFKFILIDSFSYQKISESISKMINKSSLYDLYNSPRIPEYISEFLNTALKCCNFLFKFQPVLLEDMQNIRTSVIIGSLAKILIDPYYCTYKGFIDLIQSMWVNTGCFFCNEHKIHIPLFYFWLLCVKFLFFLTPERFEFSHWLIEYLMKHLWSNWYFPFSLSFCDRDILLEIDFPSFYNPIYTTSSSIYLFLQSQFSKSKYDIWSLSFENCLFEIPIFKIKKFIKYQTKLSPLKYKWFDSDVLKKKDVLYDGDYMKLIENTYFDPDL